MLCLLLLLLLPPSAKLDTQPHRKKDLSKYFFNIRPSVFYNLFKVRRVITFIGFKPGDFKHNTSAVYARPWCCCLILSKCTIHILWGPYSHNFLSKNHVARISSFLTNVLKNTHLTQKNYFRSSYSIKIMIQWYLVQRRRCTM